MENSLQAVYGLQALFITFTARYSPLILRIKLYSPFLGDGLWQHFVDGIKDLMVNELFVCGFKVFNVISVRFYLVGSVTCTNHCEFNYESSKIKITYSYRIISITIKRDSYSIAISPLKVSLNN